MCVSFHYVCNIIENRLIRDYLLRERFQFEKKVTPLLFQPFLEPNQGIRFLKEEYRFITRFTIIYEYFLNEYRMILFFKYLKILIKYLTNCFHLEF